MTGGRSQDFWAPGGAIVRLPPRMRLAPAEIERLWKGLERFINCSDSLGDFSALGKAFPDFWPFGVWHYPGQPSDSYLKTLSDEALGEQVAKTTMEYLNWHPALHKLFLLYRDTLRNIWGGKDELNSSWFAGGRPEFLLGLSALNERAVESVKRGPDDIDFTIPFELVLAWREAHSKLPTIAAGSNTRVGMDWPQGEFHLIPRNDFQRAFYLLFRKSWRARVCSRCKTFFVARRPKQQFCGTGCSAGSRLDSKLRWWRKVGAKRRGKTRVQHEKKKK